MSPADRRRMTGADLQDAIVALAHHLGYIAYHGRPGRTAHGWRTPVSYDGKGFPDLVLAGPRGVLFLEVKGDGDRVREHQRKWIAALRSAGAQAFIVTPGDWRAGVVDRLLTNGGRP